MPATARWFGFRRSRLGAVALLAALTQTGRIAAQEKAQWSVETPTGASRQISFDATSGTWMSVSVAPDGRSLVFDLLGHIYELPADGGTAKRLTDGRSWNILPRYSPDGKYVAFSSDRTGHYDVWLLDRQTGTIRNVSLAAEGENVYRPTWSADGRRVYATTERDGQPGQLVAYDLMGGHQVLTETGGAVGGAASEPRGSGLLIEHAAAPLYSFDFNPYVIPATGVRIERYDEASGKTTVYLERPGGAFAPALSVDGQKLAYVHRLVDETVLIVQDVASRRERVVLRGLDRDRQESGAAYGPYPAIAWHPDGRRVLVALAGQLTWVDASTGMTTKIPLHAPVDRAASTTLRFKTKEPADKAATRTHRWGVRVAGGVVSEALGDLWLAEPGGGRKNLTRSAANETSPVVDPRTGTLYYAAWTDDSLGAVYRAAPNGGAPDQLTTIPSQYGSLALSPDGSKLAYVRGAGGLMHGLWLSNETVLELIVRDANGLEHRLADIATQPLEYANIAGKVPPSVQFAPDGQTVYYTEFERDTLVLKRIGLDARGETVLAQFPNAVSAVLSPDLGWIAYREYQRSFVTPLGYSGKPALISAFEGLGSSLRVDPEDGAYLTWSADGKRLGWTRGTGYYEKPLEQIQSESRVTNSPGRTGSWTGARVPGSTATRTELAVEYEIDRPTGVVALTGARIVTMNGTRQVLESGTIVVDGGRIKAIGAGIPIPSGAKVFDLKGRTVIPGLVDAHAHPHIEHSPLHVIEQQPTYLRGPLAYGVTTLIEVYGNEYRDGWMTDMLRSGKITGSRLFTTGSVIFGSRRGARLRMYRPIETLDDAREQLRWNKDHGAIAVKDYVENTRKRRQLVITAARELGLNVVSESEGDPQMNFTQILDGVTGIEHSMGLSPFYDDVVRFWRGTDAGMTPTLLVVYNGHMGEGWFHEGSKLWEDKKLTQFITPEQLMRVRSPTHLWPEDMYAWRMGAEMKKLFENGTSIQLGAHGQMLGLDAHWELALMVKSGFSPAQALEMATIRGATHHGLDADLGSLEAGKLADLVVLDANPLVDIENAQKIRYVMKNGVLFAGADAARVWPDPKPAPTPYFMGR